MLENSRLLSRGSLASRMIRLRSFLFEMLSARAGHSVRINLEREGNRR